MARSNRCLASSKSSTADRSESIPPALVLIEPHADRPQPVTLGADKAYDFVMGLREKAVTPYVAQNTNGRRSATDDPFYSPLTT
jgi:hypothetical protein